MGQQLSIVKSKPLTITKSEPSGPQVVGPNGQRMSVDDYKKQGQAEPSIVSQLFDQVGRYAARLGHNVVEPVKQVYEAAKGEMRSGLPNPQSALVMGGAKIANQMVKGALSAQGQEWVKAQEARAAGRYDKALAHLMAYAAPVVGPMLDDFVSRTAAGEGPEVAADVTTLFAAPEVAKRMPASVTVTKGRMPATPEAASAVRFAEREGIPITAGTATGNIAVKGTEQIAQNSSILGSGVGQKAAQARRQAFKEVGWKLAEESQGSATSLESAGLSARQAVERNVSRAAAEATQQYDTLRAMEANGQVIGVDVEAARQALKPIADQLAREKAIAGDFPPGPKRNAALALDRLLSGEGKVVPLTEADAVLGDLKDLLRSAKKTGGAGIDRGTGVLAKTVQELNAQVTKAAKSSAPGAYDALQQGRAATIAKWDAAEVLDSFKAEPVAFTKAVLASKDGGVQALRNIQRVAPEVLPEFGRASLENILSEAMQNGKFAGERMLAEWQKLGPSTRQLVFKDALKKNPGYLKDLDDFFTLAEMSTKSMNPSGTAAAAAVGTKLGIASVSPASWFPLILSELGAGAATKALTSPAVVKALTRGLRLPVNATTAQRAANVAALNTALKSAGIPVPVVAEREREE